MARAELDRTDDEDRPRETRRGRGGRIVDRDAKLDLDPPDEDPQRPREERRG